MGQIIGGAAKPKRCNLNKLSQLDTPAAGEYILVSSDNSMNAAGQGNFDCYIVGDGKKAATELPLKNIEEAIDELLSDEFVIAKALTRQNDTLSKIGDVTSKLGEDEEFVIAYALNELNKKSGKEDEEIKGYVSIANSDTIAILGASYSDNSTPALGKDWTTIVSSLTDYNFRDYAASGSNPMGWLNTFVRGGDMREKYAMITFYYGNGVSSSKAPKLLQNLCDALQSRGIKPILATSFDCSPTVNSFAKNLAKDRNLYYTDCSVYFALTKAGLSGIGNSGLHLGTRDIQVWSNGFVPQMQNIDRPTQSLKVFRLRSGSANKTLDELVFHTNEERFVNFREIYFGQKKSGVTYKEYDEIAGSGLTFTGGLLISAILPVDSAHLNNAVLRFTSSDDVEVYALNTLASPYPVLTSYTRFSIEEETQSIPAIGAKYSDGTNEFTAIAIVMGENGMYFTMYCTPSLSGTLDSGTLTKVSGIGENTLTYSMRENASISSESAIESDNNGHWKKIENNNGYTINTGIGYVQYDKIHFLLLAESATISNPRIEYSGTKIKETQQGVNVEFDSNELHDVQEYIQESVFGSVGTVLEHWKDDNDNSVVSVASYDGNYPFSSSVVALSGTTSMKQSVTLGAGSYWLEVCAKYLTETVDEESCDFNDLYVEVGSANPAQTSVRLKASWSYKVGLAWKFVRVPIHLGMNDTIDIRLFSNALGLQVSKVSLKKY